MTNELSALIIFALWFLDGKRINLCLAIFIYYLCVMAISTLPVYEYYTTACIIDLSVIALITAISAKYQKTVLLNSTYCAIIFISMSLSGLMLLDQASDLNQLAWVHRLFNEYVIYLDLLFAFVGCQFVQRWIVSAFLPFGGR